MAGGHEAFLSVWTYWVNRPLYPETVAPWRDWPRVGQACVVRAPTVQFMPQEHAAAATFEGRGVVEIITVEITHHIWLEWGRIAAARLHDARDARRKVLERHAAGENWAEQMEVEYAAALVGIAACAHALDGLCGALKDRVALAPRKPGESRHGRIRSAISLGFTLSNADSAAWKKDFTWLYELRDAAVHPEEKSRPTVPHPVAGHGSYEASRYCLESVERAWSILISVLAVIGAPGRAKNPDVGRYATDMRPAILTLLDTGRCQSPSGALQ